MFNMLGVFLIINKLRIKKTVDFSFFRAKIKSNDFRVVREEMNFFEVVVKKSYFGSESEGEKELGYCLEVGSVLRGIFWKK